ncbi:MAG: clostripain-related cysteine peptidase [Promethearchaeota archaeon]
MKTSTKSRIFHYLIILMIFNMLLLVVPTPELIWGEGNENKPTKEFQVKPKDFQPSVRIPKFKSCALSEWTIMVYMAGDNNLEGFAIKDLNEMESVDLPSNINIIVQMDRTPKYDTSNGDWTETRRYKVIHDSDIDLISSTLLENLGELNMGDPTTLTDFVLYGIDNYEANNYAIILWDHGGGLAGACWDDTSSSDYLNLEEIESSLRTIRSDKDLKINVLGFDACLMATFEVAYQYQEYADILIASEDVEPGDGWPYDLILENLAKKPSMSPEELATTITSRYGQFYEAKANYATTLSAISLGKFGGFATEFKEIVSDTLYPAVYDDVITTNFTDTFLVEISINRSEKYESPGVVDFYDLVANFNESKLINDSCWNNLDRGFSQLIISNYHGYQHPNSSGLTIQTNGGIIKATEKWTDWTDTLWDEFIKLYEENKQDPNYQEQVPQTIGVDVLGWILDLEADPDLNLEIPLEFLLFNQGTEVASGVQYTILEYGLNAKETPTTVSSATYGTLPSNSYAELTSYWTPTVAGWRIIELIVSTTSPEQETGNNRFSFKVWVKPATGSVEAFIWLDTESEAWPAEGNTINIYYEITNWGAADIVETGNVTIWAYDWNNSIWHRVSSSLFSLESYYYLTDYVTYTLPSGGYYYFEIDAYCPGDPYTEDDYDFYGIYVIPVDVDLDAKILSVDEFSLQGYETQVDVRVYNWGATAPGYAAAVLLYAYSEYNESQGLDPWGYIDGKWIENLDTIYDFNYYKDFTFTWEPIQGGTHDLYLWVVEDYYNVIDADLYPDNDIDYLNTFVYSLYPDLTIFLTEPTAGFTVNTESKIKFELWNIGLTDAPDVQVELYDYISSRDEEVLIVSDTFTVESFKGWLLTATWIPEFPGEHIIRITVSHPAEVLDDDNEALIYVTVAEEPSETSTLASDTSVLTTPTTSTIPLGTTSTQSRTTQSTATESTGPIEPTTTSSSPTISSGFGLITLLVILPILITIKRGRK